MEASVQIASAALRQANNSLNLAVQFLQEDPDLIQVAVQVWVYLLLLIQILK